MTSQEVLTHLPIKCRIKKREAANASILTCGDKLNNLDLNSTSISSYDMKYDKLELENYCFSPDLIKRESLYEQEPYPLNTVCSNNYPVKDLVKRHNRIKYETLYDADPYPLEPKENICPPSEDAQPLDLSAAGNGMIMNYPNNVSSPDSGLDSPSNFCSLDSSNYYKDDRKFTLSPSHSISSNPSQHYNDYPEFVDVDMTSQSSFTDYNPDICSLTRMSSPDSFCLERSGRSSESETRRRQRQSKAFYEQLSDDQKKERHRQLDNMRSRQYRNRRRLQKNDLMGELEKEEVRSQELQNKLKELQSQKEMLENIYKYTYSKRIPRPANNFMVGLK